VRRPTQGESEGEPPVDLALPSRGELCGHAQPGTSRVSWGQLLLTD
jgi:hypothetical protein